MRRVIAQRLTREMAMLGRTSAVLFLAAACFLLARAERAQSGSALTVGAMLDRLAVFAVLTSIICAVYVAVGRHRSRRMLLVGHPSETDAIVHRMRSQGGRRFDPIVLRPADITRPNITRLMLRSNRIATVVIASELHVSTLLVLLDCKRRGVRLLNAANVEEATLGRIDPALLTATDMLLRDGGVGGPVAGALKRATDVILSLAMLLLTLPLMLAAVLAIKIDSPGPVFTHQRRVGRFNREFALLRFRSLNVGDEVVPQAGRVQRGEKQITRVGWLIRASRINELPQLLNVLRGDMSLVGPCAQGPHFAEQLASAIPFYRQRWCVRPGITGWAQIKLANAGAIEDANAALAYDLYYVQNRSLLLDMIILLQTIGIVLPRRDHGSF